ncbi:choline dehydrogenase protein [Rutstroemia sp. NJR-2017a BBW]|nr:choline dehydrogenase protein [Rutstroemia sp. NJR-2017a BBW]
MSLFRLVHISWICSLCISLASCYPQFHRGWEERQIEFTKQLQKSYNYIIIVTVLVVEYGYFDNNPAQIQPRSAENYVWPIKDLYNLTSTPQPGLAGSVQAVYSASVVGGGSTVNGMFLGRGSARDYDNWGRLNNDDTWSWKGLLPYFVKSTTFQEPSPDLTKEFNITWDPKAYGNGPIRNSFAPFQWPGIKPQWKGLTEVGCEPQIDGSNGNAYGVFWVRSAIDQTTETRSYARSGYYDPIVGRENLHLLTGYRVNEVLFDKSKHAYGITMQARGTPDGSNVTVIKADKEVVLAAGGLHSPHILQRSGIGPASLLRQANISVIVDLPGVGSNLQDHPVTINNYNYTKNIWPNPDGAKSNATFVAWEEEEWSEHRRGPYSQAVVGNTAALIPLKVLTPETWEDSVKAFEKQNVSTYLPSSYTKEQIRGYKKQRALLAESFRQKDNAVIELPFNALSSFPLLLIKPVSRGTILLDPSNKYAEPILNYHSFVNPLDASNVLESIKFTRRYHAESKTMVQTFNATESVPGVTNDVELDTYIRNTTASSTAHLSGTCALTPRKLGGVVGVDLLVYGVTGLSVVDASIMPLIPGAHTCTTVYAVAEKAADLIKFRHT